MCKCLTHIPVADNNNHSGGKNKSFSLNLLFKCQNTSVPVCSCVRICASGHLFIIYKHKHKWWVVPWCLRRWNTTSCWTWKDFSLFTATMSSLFDTESCLGCCTSLQGIYCVWGGNTCTHSDEICPKRGVFWRRWKQEAYFTLFLNGILRSVEVLFIYFM